MTRVTGIAVVTVMAGMMMITKMSSITRITRDNWNNYDDC